MCIGPKATITQLRAPCLALGEPLAARLHLDRAKIIVSLDADFLGDSAASVRYARDYAARAIRRMAMPAAAAASMWLSPRRR